MKRISNTTSSTFILVTGPSGSGKTALLDAIARKSKPPIKRFYPNRVAHSLEGDSELYLSKLFKESPATLLIDDVDVLAANREDSSSTSLSRSLCGQFIRTLKIQSSTHVVVTAIEPSRLDPEFLALFRVKLRIPSLDLERRKAVLRVLTRDMPLHEGVSLDRVAGVTSGFRPADLLNLCREAAFRSVRRDAERIEWNDFKDALRVVRSNLLSIATGQEEAEEKHDNDDNTRPRIDLPGLRSQKELLETCVLYPLCSKTTNLPMNPPKGIIVYGATGTGKTRLCNELGRALRGRAQFISVSCPSLLSKVVGETEKNISQIFRRARSLAPSVRVCFCCCCCCSSGDLTSPTNPGTLSRSHRIPRTSTW